MRVLSVIVLSVIVLSVTVFSVIVLRVRDKLWLEPRLAQQQRGKLCRRDLVEANAKVALLAPHSSARSDPVSASDATSDVEDRGEVEHAAVSVDAAEAEVAKGWGGLTRADLVHQRGEAADRHHVARTHRGGRRSLRADGGGGSGRSAGGGRSRPEAHWQAARTRRRSEAKRSSPPTPVNGHSTREATLSFSAAARALCSGILKSQCLLTHTVL